MNNAGIYWECTSLYIPWNLYLLCNLLKFILLLKLYLEVNQALYDGMFLACLRDDVPPRTDMQEIRFSLNLQLWGSHLPIRKL